MTTTTATRNHAELTPANFDLMVETIYRQSGIVLEKQKQYLLEARLAKILKERRLASINDYCALIRKGGDSAILKELVEAMTTHETSFFRDAPQFDIIREELLPKILPARQSRRRLAFWSAAASGGQEACTLAITLLEMPQLNGWKLDILATDISDKILSRARAAVYSEHDLARGLTKPLIAKYFKKEGESYRALDVVRNMVRFERLDLRQPMRGLGVFDIVFCRNVMIYFDHLTKRRIFEELAGVTAPDGALFLGSTETSLGLTERFSRHASRGAVYYTPVGR